MAFCGVPSTVLDGDFESGSVVVVLLVVEDVEEDVMAVVVVGPGSVVAELFGGCTSSVVVDPGLEVEVEVEVGSPGPVETSVEVGVEAASPGATVVPVAGASVVVG